MPRFNTIKNSFISGELSPKLEGRTDLEQYKNGCKTLENMIVLPHGGISRRMGSRFIADITDEDFADGGRIIPFKFDRTTAYAIVLGLDWNFQIYKNDGTECTIDTQNLLTTNFPFNFSDANDLKDIQFTQSGDVIYLVHPDHMPILIIRTGDTTFEAYAWNIHLVSTLRHTLFPYMDRPLSGITLTPSGTSLGAITLTASDDYFVSEHTGAYFRISHGSTTGFVVIGDINSATSADATVVSALGATTATSDWQESAWNSYRGFPSAITIHGGRLIMGGTRSQPDTFWGSRIGRYNQFMQERLYQDASSPTSTTGTFLAFYGERQESDPYAWTPGAQELNRMQWIKGARNLSFGTAGGEFTADSGFGAISPPSLRQHTAVGSRSTKPLLVGHSILHVSRDGHSLRQMAYEYEIDGYVNRDLQLLSEHIPRTTREDGSVGSQIIHITYQNSERIVWVKVDSTSGNGGLAGFTYDPHTGIASWHRHTLGGELDDNEPSVDWLESLPDSDGAHDNLWMLVRRTIDGSTVQYLEMIGPQFDGSATYESGAGDDEKPYFLDCSLRVTSGTPTDTFTGFDHLAGETVKVLADGYVHPDVTVDASGNIELDYNATEVIAGFGYTHKFQSLRLDDGAAIGSSQGALKRIDRVVARFYKTVHANIGWSEDKVKPITFRENHHALDEPVPLFTGDKVIPFVGNNDRDGYIWLTGSEPLPCTLLALIVRGETHD